jgi:lipopolysaccharide/colanic/teichoic acid biosynthesis glycosyltransferase
MLVTAPIFGAVALAIKLDSPGPVFFRQTRLRQDGLPFAMLKFRSMRSDAVQLRSQLLEANEAKGPVFKIRQDPRMTRVGRFLRRASLDELPQLWHVLMGEMSMVGPRPPLPAEVALYEPWQRERLCVKPGLTCTWQVGGRSNIPFEQWVQMDIDYIRTRNLGQDLRILLQTIPAVLTARGAY